MIVRMALGAMLALTLWSGAVAADGFFPSRYDREIQQAVKRWWPDFPFWRMLKAQLYQESRLDPGAVSPAGARGLAQFMPDTWSDMIGQMRLPGPTSPHDRVAIEAAGYYMARLRQTWRERRSTEERHDLALASYNAGIGNMLAAQQACGGARAYSAIVECLPAVTGRHASETIAYVKAVHRWFALMEARP